MNDSVHMPKVSASGEGQKMMVLGQEITVILSSADTGGDYYLFENIVAAGSRVPAHIHHREDEILQVMEGELEVYLAGKTFKASSGAVAFFPRNTVHGFGNVSEKTAKGRFFVSPGQNFENFFGELSALPADRPPDMTKVLQIFERYGLPIVQEPVSG